MQLLASREYPVIDYQTLSEFVGHERLFRGADGSFLLHMTEDKSDAERLVWFETRDAINWLHETPDQYGNFWIEMPTCG
jgi:hypothetical protein